MPVSAYQSYYIYHHLPSTEEGLEDNNHCHKGERFDCAPEAQNRTPRKKKQHRLGAAVAALVALAAKENDLPDDLKKQLLAEAQTRVSRRWRVHVVRERE